MLSNLMYNLVRVPKLKREEKKTRKLRKNCCFSDGVSRGFCGSSSDILRFSHNFALGGIKEQVVWLAFTYELYLRLLKGFL